MDFISVKLSVLRWTSIFRKKITSNVINTAVNQEELNDLDFLWSYAHAAEKHGIYRHFRFKKTVVFPVSIGYVGRIFSSTSNLGVKYCVFGSNAYETYSIQKECFVHAHKMTTQKKVVLWDRYWAEDGSRWPVRHKKKGMKSLAEEMARVMPAWLMSWSPHGLQMTVGNSNWYSSMP